MTVPRWLSVFAALCVMLSAVADGYAQTTTNRTDLFFQSNLHPDGTLHSDNGIPNLLTGALSVIRSDDLGTIKFDALLDPSNGSDPNRLTDAARSIIRNHLVAQQQVELAIRYLLANRDQIIAGNDPFFNQIYGKPSGKKKFAVLAPVSLPGTFSLASSSVLRAMAQAGGGGGGGGNQPRISVGTLLKPGDSLFLVDPTSNPNNNNNNNLNIVKTTYPNQATLGYVVNIAAVIRGGINNAGGNQNNQNNQNTDFIIDPPATNVPVGTALTNVTAWRIVRFEDRNDTTAYDQVLATFMATRDALAGFDPGQLRGQQTRRDVTYNRRYAPITSFYRTGDADFTQLDGLVDQRVPGFTADRLTRQAGFSLSDSHYHLDRLYDIANAQATDYRGRPVTPLLWTQDDEIPLQFGSNTQVPNKGDEDRAFFRDRMTIFGDRDNFTGANANTPIDQYIGRAFLEEQILHAGDFFDFGTVAATNLDQMSRDQRLPARGALQFTPAGPNTPAVPISDGPQPVPESGDPITKSTLRKWQMILSSFAEWSSDLDHSDLNNPNIRNVAALGLMDITGGTGSPILRSRDAGNFALFADLIGGAAGGGIDFSRVEPLGKRAGAGFNPVVPSN